MKERDVVPVDVYRHGPFEDERDGHIKIGRIMADLNGPSPFVIDIWRRGYHWIIRRPRRRRGGTGS